MGVLILFMVSLYVFVANMICKIILKFSKRKTLSRFIFIFILLFPFSDLMVQKAIKTYYQVFKLEPKIYSYPEKDKDGKIESLGLTDVTLESKDELKEKYIYSYYSKYVNDYVEVSVRNYEVNGPIKKVKIYLNNKSKKFEYIKIVKAKYQVISLKPKIYMFGLFEVKLFYIMNSDKKLAEAILIGFDRLNNIQRYIRNNILFLTSGASGEVELFWVSQIDNLDETMEKVFNINNNLYTGKGL